MARMKVEYNDKILRRNTKNFNNDLRRAIKITMDRHAQETVGWMKTNARWTDRTGAARSGLTATTLSGANFEEILLAYSVDYGIWLEIANDRQYSIITPAMRIMGDMLMKRMEYLIDRMHNI